LTFGSTEVDGGNVFVREQTDAPEFLLKSFDLPQRSLFVLLGWVSIDSITRLPKLVPYLSVLAV
jgi:hypothetical protein